MTDEPIDIEEVRIEAFGERTPVQVIRQDGRTRVTLGDPVDLQRAMDQVTEGLAGVIRRFADFSVFDDMFSAFLGTKDPGELTHRDRKIIRRLLMGLPPKGSETGQLVTRFVDSGRGSRWYSVFSEHGGYNLLTRSHSESPFLLNLDHAVMLTGERVAQWREEVCAIEEGLKLSNTPHFSVLPVSVTALRRGVGRTPVQRDSIALVHRQGLECVLTLTEDDEVRYYLSGYDTQEDPPLYFLCRLPHAVASVDEARLSLAPESVLLALGEGKRIERQGDLFAIRSDVTDQDIIAAGGGIASAQLKLYGTSHTAARLAQLPDGRMLASGRLIHKPSLNGENRRPDHRDRELDDGWWWVSRNTVPIQR